MKKRKNKFDCPAVGVYYPKPSIQLVAKQQQNHQK